MNHRVAVRSFPVAAVLCAMGCASSGGPGPSVWAPPYARSGYVTTEATASTYRAPASSSTPGAYGGNVVQSAPPAEAPPAASPPPPPMPSSPGSVVSGGGASVAPRYDGAAVSSDDALRRSSAQPSPQERPGLATQWGENRESAVRFTSFERATTAPFEVASIHYNDAGWAAIQARYHGGGGPRVLTHTRLLQRPGVEGAARAQREHEDPWRSAHGHTGEQGRGHARTRGEAG
mgnify:CR=1 FL=1